MFSVSNLVTSGGAPDPNLQILIIRFAQGQGRFPADSHRIFFLRWSVILHCSSFEKRLKFAARTRTPLGQFLKLMFTNGRALLPSWRCRQNKTILLASYLRSFGHDQTLQCFFFFVFFFYCNLLLKAVEGDLYTTRTGIVRRSSQLWLSSTASIVWTIASRGSRAFRSQSLRG